MLRRDEGGWREIGLFTWKVEREDNHGDRSTSTIIDAIFIGHWSTSIRFTRPWEEDDANS